MLVRVQSPVPTRKKGSNLMLLPFFALGGSNKPQLNVTPSFPLDLYANKLFSYHSFKVSLQHA